MKKVILYLALFCTPVIKVMAQGMVFAHGTWAEVVKEAKEKNRPIFVDVYTSWCGPCKVMSSTVFPREEVGKAYNTNYVNFKIDAEKGEGIELAKKYAVKAYPTYLFIDPKTEQLIENALGSMPAATFVDLGNRIYNKYANVKQASIAEMNEQFKLGKYDEAWLQGYIKRLIEDKVSSDEAMEQYVKKYLQEGKGRDDQYGFLALYANTGNEHLYQLLCDFYPKIDKALKKDGVAAASFDNDLAGKTDYRISKLMGDKQLTLAEKEVKLAKLFNNLNVIVTAPGKAGMKIAGYKMDLYSKAKDEQKLIEARHFYLKNYLIPDGLNHYIGGEVIVMDKNEKMKPYIDSTNISNWCAGSAVYYAKNAKEKVDKDLCKELMNKAMRFNKSTYTEMQQAALLYNIGDREQAVAQQEKLLGRLEQSGDPYLKKGQELLAKMKEQPESVFGVIPEMRRVKH